jgi:aspartyl-tRNA(Asn)/glutamyl-tRNA(Gln) amidotransferase subunit C
MISKEMIRRIANTVKLAFTEEEEEKLAEDLRIFVKYIDTMDKLDTDGVEPMPHVHNIENVLREDVARDMDDSKALLNNAPKRKDNFIVVPKTVE